MSETVNLNEIMEGNVPHRSTTVIDLTGNNQNQAVETNPQPQKSAIPVSSGPIDMNTIQTVDVNSILPKRAPAVNPMEASMMADLDAAIERECESITKRVDAIADAQRAEIEKEHQKREDEIQAANDDFALNGNNSTYMAAEDADGLGLYEDDTYDIVNINKNATRVSAYSDSTSSGTDTHVYENNIPAEDTDNNDDIIVERNVNKPSVNILDHMSDDDIFDPEDETSENQEREETADEVLKDLKGQIKNKISPVRKKFDLSKFSITQKSISAQKVMKLAVTSHQNIADWVMFSACRPISMTGLSGPEILKLNPENSNRNRLNTFRDMYRIIYDHIYDGNKPEFETWLKQTRFVDLQHIYFALYMATFGGSNFINYSCPKCKKLFIDDVKFEEMVGYADEETRNKVRSMLKMDTTSPSNDSYESDLIQVSNTYAFALRSPSIWNVIIETASLSDQFLEKYADLIDMVAYIEAIYIIDAENNTLVPVDTKPDPNDQAKTSARRIKAFYDIISTLSSEDYYGLRAAINEYDEDASKLTYKIPGRTCPECSTEIPTNTDVNPDSMLFTRHQLAAIGNM